MARRFFRHGELPLVLLALLSERSRHGYEILAELSRLFGPRYRPSPGSVYPAIDALRSEGLIDGLAEQGKTTYRATEAGDEALEARRDVLVALELRTGARVIRANGLDPVLARFKARLAPLSDRLDPELVETVLDRAAGVLERTVEELDGLDGLPTTKEKHR